MVSNFSLVFFGRNFNANDTNNAALTTFEDFQLRVKIWTNGVAGWWADPRGGIEVNAGLGPTNPAPFGITANPLTGEAYPTFRHTVDLSAHGLRVAAGQSVVMAPVFRRDATDKLVRLSLSKQEGPADLYAGFQGVTNWTTATDLGVAQYATALTVVPGWVVESPLRITALDGGLVRIEMTGQAGKLYRLEVSTTLAPDSWSTAQEKTAGTDGRVSFEESVAAGQSWRFYRVAWTP
jgi:hypothetical protein